MASKSSPTDPRACEGASTTKCRNGVTSSPKPASSRSDRDVIDETVHDLNLILRSARKRASRRMGRGPHGSRRPLHGLLTMRVSLALRSNFGPDGQITSDFQKSCQV